MIDVKTIIKPKGAANGAAPTGAAQAGRAVRTADEALHAAHADRAGKAGRADSAAYADKAGDAQTARWAAVADAVTDGVRDEFISSKADDAAEGVITFLKGLLLGDGTRGIDADGNATLGGVTAEAADIARAAIRRMTSDVAFERLATFARGLVATMIESPGYEAGSRGFGLHKTEGGRYRLEVDELMVRVKAMFDELEVRRLSYSGGCMVLSAAASRICRVRPLRHGEGAGPYAWRCYFAKDDGTMRTRNWWRVGDQAKCQTMNIDGPEAARARLLALGDRPVSADGDGTPLGWRAPRTGNAGNRYYWRLVTAVGTETLDDGREYDWVELSNERAVTLAGADGGSVDCVGYDTTFDGGDADGMKWHADANDAPMAGDEIVQQGSQTDPGRQHLILLSAVGERAPSIEEYADVGRSDGPGPYSLTGRCMTSMSPRSGNMFRARRFEIETDGGAVRVPCHRGAWQAGIHYSYYDQVGHAGGLWLCVAPGGTESEPGHGGGWEQQVAPGKDGTPGRDGADNAVRAWLSPVSLVATETAPGVFELSESVLALNVVRGTGDDITGECRVVSARGMGCTASVDGVDTVEVTGATGDGGTIAVVAGVALPGGGVVECRADYAINRLGTFRETIENDVKRQVAQREFAYSDAYGRQHTVAGMSAVAQSAEQVRQEVWRRQPAGSVVANGTFADGLERWSVEGGVVAAWWQGVPCARLTPAGAATALHQSAADMACDWGALGVGKDGVPLRARVSMRVATDGGCRLRVGLEGSGVDVEAVDVEAVDVEAGGWRTVAIGGTGGVALRRAPGELVVALERGECRVTDIQVVPDVAVMVGTRLTQTADGIAMLVGGMAKGLQATGIDIASRKVTVTADSFMVMNNRGEATAAVDADGNLVAGSLKAGGKAGGKASGKASVAMGVDGEGKPYLVGTNARGEVVWRLDGNGYVNSTPDVAMAVAGGRAYFANRMDGGYDIRYEVGVRVTNRQLAQVTFTPGGHLGCYIQKSRTEQSAWVALAQKEAVAIASGASGVVTFSGASTVGGSRGAAPAVPFGNGDTLDVRLCYKGEGRGVGLVTCGLEA